MVVCKFRLDAWCAKNNKNAHYFFFLITNDENTSEMIV